MSQSASKSALSQAIRRFSNGRVLVIGDLVIDEMVYGHTHRLSREAPVLILRHDHADIILGAAGNAAHNIAKLNAKHTAVVGIAGKDYYSTLLVDALERDGIDASALVFDESRPTSTKTRISGIANQSVTQQVVRIDRESNAALDPKIENRLLDTISKRIAEFDAVILSDYGLAVLSPEVISLAQTLCKKHKLMLSVDTQRQMREFKHATIMTPNQPEAEQNLGYVITSRETLVQGGKALLAETESEHLLITRGGDGMALFDAKGTLSELPAFNRSEVFDVNGAGDTVIATLTLASCTGSSMLEAAILGNLAASIVVRRFGAATTNQDELQASLEQLDDMILETVTAQAQLPV